ncbi:MAG: signal peptidase II [Bacillota bacterium]
MSQDSMDQKRMLPLPLALTAAAIVLIDRLTKFAVVRNMSEMDSIPIIPGVFNLTYVRNPGAAFGLLPYKTIFFIIITLAVVGLIVFFAGRLREGGLAYQIAFGLMLGGALGNLWDRLHGGLVIDFLDFRVWPVFNIADSSLVVGVLVFAYLVLKSPEPGAEHKGGRP